MADEREDWRPVQHKGHPDDPANPPQSVLAPEVRRTALMSYLGPIIALFAIVGVALIYWVNRSPANQDVRDEDTIGTVGREAGGFDPAPGFDDARDEIEFRGGGESGRAAAPALTTIDRALSTDPSQPQRVTLTAVEVERIDGDVAWVRSGDARIAVTPADGVDLPRAGARVDVAGTTELDARGTVRIRARAIDVR